MSTVPLGAARTASAAIRLSFDPATRWSTSTPRRLWGVGPNPRTAAARPSTPSSSSTTTPSIRRSSPHTFSTSSASCRPSTQIRLGRATRAGTSGTASGSVAVPDVPARVARPSRIWVEGRHAAELVEKVWGDDLRIEGVVVEMLDGVDGLVQAVRGFGPTPHSRLGVLVDHLVAGSKESRIAADAVRAAPSGTVLVVGHPYVDVWQAVRLSFDPATRWSTSTPRPVSYTHLRAHETDSYLVCRLLLEK